MVAFVNHATFLTKPKVPVPNDMLCRKNLTPKYRRLLRSTIRAQAQSSSKYPEDDDESFGSESSFGVRLPNMPEKEREYLNAATSDKDFIERMRTVARRMDQQESINRARSGRQSADDYIESLSRVSLHTSKSPQKYAPSQTNSVTPPVISTSSPPLSSLTSPFAERDESVLEQESVEDIEARIQQLNSDLMNAVNTEERPQNSDSVVERDDYRSEDLTESAAELNALQEKIRTEIRDRAPDPSSIPSPSAGPSSEPVPRYENSNVVDKQIAYLESYLEKLQLEAQAEDGTNEDGGNEYYEDSERTEKAREEALSLMEEVNKRATQMPDEESSQIQFKGLEDSPGGMTAEEKQAAFESLRKRALMQREPLGEFSDPYNVTLPEKKNDAPNLDDGDVPTGDESEYDSFAPSAMDRKLLIEEIRMEMKSYTDETRRQLRNHESRMNTLLTRLIATTLDE